MQMFDTNPFDAELEIIATLRDKTIQSSIALAEQETEFKDALRSALEKGIDVDSLSDASGLPPEQIRALTVAV